MQTSDPAEWPTSPGNEWPLWDQSPFRNSVPDWLEIRKLNELVAIWSPSYQMHVDFTLPAPDDIGPHIHCLAGAILHKLFGTDFDLLEGNIARPKLTNRQDEIIEKGLELGFWKPCDQIVGYGKRK